MRRMSGHSVRIPPDMLRKLNRLARRRGAPKSQLVREALDQYFAAAQSARVTHPMSMRQRSWPYIGAVSLPECNAADSISVRMYRQNWRD